MDVRVRDIHTHAQARMLNRVEQFPKNTPVRFPLILQADRDARIACEHICPELCMSLDKFASIARYGDEWIESQMEDDLFTAEPPCRKDVPLNSTLRDRRDPCIGAVKREVKKRAMQRFHALESRKFSLELPFHRASDFRVIERLSADEGCYFNAQTVAPSKGETLVPPLPAQRNQKCKFCCHVVARKGARAKQAG